MRRHRRSALIWLAVASIICGLFWFQLGSLVSGLSKQEVVSASAAVGWHGIYGNPFYLPLKIVRSVVFFLAPDHGQLLSRLPNTFFGISAVVLFAWLMRAWHGTRSAIFTTALFASSAWLLHVSRLASVDVLYVWGIVVLLLIDHSLPRMYKRGLVYYGALAAWAMLLYIPGLIWFVAIAVFMQRKALRVAYKYHSGVVNKLKHFILAGAALSLLAVQLSRGNNWRVWLGLPDHFESPLTILKQFAEVPIQLFIAGPRNAELWLGRLPVFDIFVLIMAGLGMYFYVRHIKAHRAKLLSALFIAGWLLAALNSTIGLNTLVPIVYAASGTGLAYVLLEWLRKFPINPLARSVGIGLVAVAVSLSCIYNLRSYFIAWPHNNATKSVFVYHL